MTKKTIRETSLSSKLSHIDSTGKVKMVDVTDKPVSTREAIAKGRINITPAALKIIRSGKIAKGNPLQTARLAGIMAAKRTAELIPLCHQLLLTYVDLKIHSDHLGYEIEACVRTKSETGAEMEALTAVTVASLTIYDMVKAIDRTMEIGQIRLVEKRGGSSGDYKKSGE